MQAPGIYQYMGFNSEKLYTVSGKESPDPHSNGEQVGSWETITVDMLRFVIIYLIYF